MKRFLMLVALTLVAAAVYVTTALGGFPAGVNSRQVEQLGPKYLLDPRSPQVRPINATTRAILVDEFGPKYLLGYELKAARSQALLTRDGSPR